MTLSAWTMIVSAELKAEGFEVSECQGFPLVKCPKSFEDTLRLVRFRLKQFPADREIYAEGMLFIPAGARRAADKLKAEKEATA